MFLVTSRPQDCSNIEERGEGGIYIRAHLPSHVLLQLFLPSTVLPKHRKSLSIIGKRGATDRQTDTDKHRQTQTDTDKQRDRQTNRHRRTNRPTIRQTDRQTDKQTKRHIETQTSKQTDRQTNKPTQTDRHRQTDTDRQTQTYRQTDRHTDRHRQTQTDRQTNRQTDKETYRQRDNQTHRQTHKQTDRQTDRHNTLPPSPESRNHIRIGRVGGGCRGRPKQSGRGRKGAPVVRAIFGKGRCGRGPCGALKNRKP